MTGGFTLPGSPHSLPTYRVALMLRLCRTGFSYRYVSFQRGTHLAVGRAAVTANLQVITVSRHPALDSGSLIPDIPVTAA